MSVIGRFSPSLDSTRVRVALLTGVLTVALLVVVSRLPRSIEGTGTLDRCYWGSPVIQLEGDWRGALPAHVRAYAPTSLPVAAWPAGTSFDEEAGELRDSTGAVLYRLGERVSIKGAVIEVRGDIPRCFYMYQLRVDSIGPVDEPGHGA